jgi:uncharacterized membrane protein
MIAMMLGYGSGWPLWETGLMWAGMIAVLGILIWAGYALITSATRTPGTGHGGEDPRRILDGRLASGEIDAAEYQRLRDLITADGTQAPGVSGIGR